MGRLQLFLAVSSISNILAYTTVYEQPVQNEALPHRVYNRVWIVPNMQVMPNLPTVHQMVPTLQHGVPTSPQGIPTMQQGIPNLQTVTIEHHRHPDWMLPNIAANIAQMVHENALMQNEQSLPTVSRKGSPKKKKITSRKQMSGDSVADDEMESREVNQVSDEKNASDDDVSRIGEDRNASNDEEDKADTEEVRDSSPKNSSKDTKAKPEKKKPSNVVTEAPEESELAEDENSTEGPEAESEETATESVSENLGEKAEEKQGDEKPDSGSPETSESIPDEASNVQILPEVGALEKKVPETTDEEVQVLPEVGKVAPSRQRRDLQIKVSIDSKSAENTNDEEKDKSKEIIELELRTVDTKKESNEDIFPSSAEAKPGSTEDPQASSYTEPQDLIKAEDGVTTEDATEETTTVKQEEEAKDKLPEPNTITVSLTPDSNQDLLRLRRHVDYQTTSAIPYQNVQIVDLSRSGHSQGSGTVYPTTQMYPAHFVHNQISDNVYPTHSIHQAETVYQSQSSHSHFTPESYVQEPVTGRSYRHGYTVSSTAEFTPQTNYQSSFNGHAPHTHDYENIDSKPHSNYYYPVNPSRYYKSQNYPLNSQNDYAKDDMGLSREIYQDSYEKEYSQQYREKNNLASQERNANKTDKYQNNYRERDYQNYRPINGGQLLAKNNAAEEKTINNDHINSDFIQNEPENDDSEHDVNRHEIIEHREELHSLEKLINNISSTEKTEAKTPTLTISKEQKHQIKQRQINRKPLEDVNRSNSTKIQITRNSQPSSRHQNLLKDNNAEMSAQEVTHLTHSGENKESRHNDERNIKYKSEDRNDNDKNKDDLSNENSSENIESRYISWPYLRNRPAIPYIHRGRYLPYGYKSPYLYDDDYNFLSRDSDDHDTTENEDLDGQKIQSRTISRRIIRDSRDDQHLISRNLLSHKHIDESQKSKISEAQILKKRNTAKEDLEQDSINSSTENSKENIESRYIHPYLRSPYLRRRRPISPYRYNYPYLYDDEYDALSRDSDVNNEENHKLSNLGKQDSEISKRHTLVNSSGAHNLRTRNILKLENDMENIQSRDSNGVDQGEDTDGEMSSYIDLPNESDENFIESRYIHPYLHARKRLPFPYRGRNSPYRYNSRYLYDDDYGYLSRDSDINTDDQTENDENYVLNIESRMSNDNGFNNLGNDHKFRANDNYNENHDEKMIGDTSSAQIGLAVLPNNFESSEENIESRYIHPHLRNRHISPYSRHDYNLYSPHRGHYLPYLDNDYYFLDLNSDDSDVNLPSEYKADNILINDNIVQSRNQGEGHMNPVSDQSNNFLNKQNKHVIKPNENHQYLKNVQTSQVLMPLRNIEKNKPISMPVLQNARKIFGSQVQQEFTKTGHHFNYDFMGHGADSLDIDLSFVKTIPDLQNVCLSLEFVKLVCSALTDMSNPNEIKVMKDKIMKLIIADNTRSQAFQNILNPISFHNNELSDDINVYPNQNGILPENIESKPFQEDNFFINNNNGPISPNLNEIPDQIRLPYRTNNLPPKNPALSLQDSHNIEPQNIGLLGPASTMSFPYFVLHDNDKINPSAVSNSPLDDTYYLSPDILSHIPSNEKIPTNFNGSPVQEYFNNEPLPNEDENLPEQFINHSPIVLTDYLKPLNNIDDRPFTDQNIPDYLYEQTLPKDTKPEGPNYYADIISSPQYQDLFSDKPHIPILPFVGEKNKFLPQVPNENSVPNLANDQNAQPLSFGNELPYERDIDNQNTPKRPFDQSVKPDSIPNGPIENLDQIRPNWPLHNFEPNPNKTDQLTPQKKYYPLNLPYTKVIPTSNNATNVKPDILNPLNGISFPSKDIPIETSHPPFNGNLRPENQFILENSDQNPNMFSSDEDEKHYLPQKENLKPLQELKYTNSKDNSQPVQKYLPFNENNNLPKVYPERYLRPTRLNPIPGHFPNPPRHQRPSETEYLEYLPSDFLDQNPHRVHDQDEPHHQKLRPHRPNHLANVPVHEDYRPYPSYDQNVPHDHNQRTKHGNLPYKPRLEEEDYIEPYDLYNPNGHNPNYPDLVHHPQRYNHRPHDYHNTPHGNKKRYRPNGYNIPKRPYVEELQFDNKVRPHRTNAQSNKPFLLPISYDDIYPSNKGYFNPQETDFDVPENPSRPVKRLPLNKKCFNMYILHQKLPPECNTLIPKRHDISKHRVHVTTERYKEITHKFPEIRPFLAQDSDEPIYGKVPLLPNRKENIEDLPYFPDEISSDPEIRPDISVEDHRNNKPYANYPKANDEQIPAITPNSQMHSVLPSGSNNEPFLPTSENNGKNLLYFPNEVIPKVSNDLPFSFNSEEIGKPLSYFPNTNIPSHSMNKPLLPTPESNDDNLPYFLPVINPSDSDNRPLKPYRDLYGETKPYFPHYIKPSEIKNPFIPTHESGKYEPYFPHDFNPTDSNDNKFIPYSDENGEIIPYFPHDFTPTDPSNVKFLPHHGKHGIALPYEEFPRDYNKEQVPYSQETVVPTNFPSENNEYLFPINEDVATDTSEVDPFYKKALVKFKYDLENLKKNLHNNIDKTEPVIKAFVYMVKDNLDVPDNGERVPIYDQELPSAIKNSVSQYGHIYDLSALLPVNTRIPLVYETLPQVMDDILPPQKSFVSPNTHRWLSQIPFYRDNFVPIFVCGCGNDSENRQKVLNMNNGVSVSVGMKAEPDLSMKRAYSYKTWSSLREPQGTLNAQLSTLFTRMNDKNDSVKLKENKDYTALNRDIPETVKARPSITVNADETENEEPAIHNVKDSKTKDRSHSEVNLLKIPENSIELPDNSDEMDIKSQVSGVGDDNGTSDDTDDLDLKIGNESIDKLKVEDETQSLTRYHKNQLSPKIEKDDGDKIQRRFQSMSGVFDVPSYETSMFSDEVGDFEYAIARRSQTNIEKRLGNDSVTTEAENLSENNTNSHDNVANERAITENSEINGRIKSNENIDDNAEIKDDTLKTRSSLDSNEDESFDLKTRSGNPFDYYSLESESSEDLPYFDYDSKRNEAEEVIGDSVENHSQLAQDVSESKKGFAPFDDKISNSEFETNVNKRLEPNLEDSNDNDELSKESDVTVKENSAKIKNSKQIVF